MTAIRERINAPRGLYVNSMTREQMPRDQLRHRGQAPVIDAAEAPSRTEGCYASVDPMPRTDFGPLQ